MLIPTPFDPRTAARNETHEWRDWVGYRGAAVYGPSFEREYWAVRNAVGLIDISPLFKYELLGPQATAALDRIVTRNVAAMPIGQVVYTPWCDDRGKVVDDGTVTRLAADRFRVTAAEPSLRWLTDGALGFDCSVVDVSTDVAALALQGPSARAVLQAAVDPPSDIAPLGYFRHCTATVAGVSVSVTRTGYTGDLGYELWVDRSEALRLWDALEAAGRPYGLTSVGLAALDVLRVEAGLLMLGVDYTSSTTALTAEQTSSPNELGLGWAVATDKEDFIGAAAIRGESSLPPRWRGVGVEVCWPDLERLYASVDLPPQVAGRVARGKTPIYRHGRQVGHATSTVFSPILKRYVALATVAAEASAVATPLELEVTVEAQRLRAPALVVSRPFFNPARKRL